MPPVADSDTEIIRAALSHLNHFTPTEIDSCRATRLAGLTNRVYRVDVAGEALAVRIPGGGLAALVDRKAEIANARAAMSLGLTPPLLWASDEGVIVTPFLTDAVSLSPEAFREGEGALERCAAALRRLHDAPISFLGRVQPAEILGEYADAVDQSDLSPRARRSIAKVDLLRDVLAPLPCSRPCHCDPTGPNLLDDGKQVVLIDWEYSAMSEPMWDVSCLSTENRFDGVQDARLLRSYFGRPPGAAEAGLFLVLKAALSLLSAMWALRQRSSGHAANLAVYADERLARAEGIIDAADFAVQLDAATCG
jgi:thiamine kinase-like enzyme